MGILHMEIILECILPRLPAKSLIRFKCVSKSFLAEISSPKFIKLQHHYAMSLDSNRLLILPIEHQGVYLYDIDSPHFPPPSFCPYPEPTSYAPFMSLLATCEGSLLIAYGLTHLSDLFLLNPSTRTYREIPNEEIPSMSYALYGVWHCLDKFNDEYRIVRFVNRDGIEGQKLEVKVYNTKTNTWKEIGFKAMVNTFITCCGNTPVLVRNHLLHLLFFEGGHGLPRDHIKSIGCFDMKAEQWSNDVQLPDILRDENGFDCSLHGPYKLSALDDQLCFKGYNVIDSSFHLWVMKEYGMKESWVKLMSVRTVSSDYNSPRFWQESYHPLAYHSESPHQLLCMKGRYKAKLYWYNLKDKEDTVAEFSPPLNRAHKWGPIAYICKGSLLDIPGGQPIRVSVEEFNDDKEEEDIPPIRVSAEEYNDDEKEDDIPPIRVSVEEYNVNEKVL